MSKDSKPTKKATVSEDSKSLKKGTVSNDSESAEKSAVSDDNKPTENTTVSHASNPTEKVAVGETPVFDFTKLMSQFRLPGVDFAALVDRERKNIEALVKANRIAFEGRQRLVRRQAEMLQETMKKVVADAGQEDAKKKRADVAKEGFEKALANMRELAEMTTRSQKEAFDVVRKRIEENMEGIRNFGKKLANELHPLAGAGDLLTSSQLISRRDICRWPLRPAHERPGALPNRQSHLTSPEQAIAHLNQVIARGSDLDTIKRAVNAVTRRSRRISAVKWH